MAGEQHAPMSSARAQSTGYLSLRAREMAGKAQHGHGGEVCMLCGAEGMMTETTQRLLLVDDDDDDGGG